MRAFGGMVSFTVHGGENAAIELCSRTRVFTLAESLGAVESLIEHPARMTHASTAGTSNEVPSPIWSDSVSDSRRSMTSRTISSQALATLPGV